MHECANCSCGNMTAKQFAVLFSFCGDEHEGSGRASTGETGEELPEPNHGEKAANTLPSGCIPSSPPKITGWADPCSFGSGAEAGLRFMLADLSPSVKISFQVGGCSK